MPHLLIEHERLEVILNNSLVGLDLNYKLRTRSKVLKAAVCEALGYPVPAVFARTKPRFPGQNFDTYIQKANNLQIWNDDVCASRRYVLIRVDANQVVTKVRVVTGEVLQRLDRTGKLTHKYQARSRLPVEGSECVSKADTANVIYRLLGAGDPRLPGILPIRDVYSALSKLIGRKVPDPGLDQERNRGGGLHDAACRALGIPSWRDDGQFPDITEQLLEVKLQTASTVDLGLVCPNSTEQLADFPDLCHCDVRYAVIYGSATKTGVSLDHLVLTTGVDFFTYFRQFGGKIKNSKLQIPLPRDFFD